MIRPFLAPRWLAWHAALMITLIAFIVFGQWQFGAFTQTGGGVEASGGERVSLASLADPGERLTEHSVGRRVAVAGRYAADHQLLVPAREHRGETGFLVVTPLRTADGVVAVNRGWVARARDARPVPSADVIVHAILQRSEQERAARVDALAPLPPGRIPYVATVQLLAALPYDPPELYDGHLLLTAQQPPGGATPVPVDPPEPEVGVARWRNLAYGLQWWLFAGAAVFFWGFVIRRAAHDLRRARDGASEAAHPRGRGE